MRTNILTKNIVKRREEKGLTQEYLAKLMGKRKQNISRIETKGEIISVNESTLHSLCNYLNCTEDYLKGESSDPEKNKDGLSRPITRETDMKQNLIRIINRISYSKIPLLLHIAVHIEKCNTTQIQILETICSSISKKDFNKEIKYLTNSDKLAFKIKETILDFICDEIYIHKLPDIVKPKNSNERELQKEKLKNYCSKIEYDFKEYFEDKINNLFLH